MEVGLQNKIDSLQALRFFAAFSVMMVHMPIFGVGNWGVDIFFCNQWIYNDVCD